jgi:hypothetical protein
MSDQAVTPMPSQCNLWRPLLGERGEVCGGTISVHVHGPNLYCHTCDRCAASYGPAADGALRGALRDKTPRGVLRASLILLLRWMRQDGEDITTETLALIDELLENLKDPAFWRTL